MVEIEAKKKKFPKSKPDDLEIEISKLHCKVEMIWLASHGSLIRNRILVEQITESLE
jgi:hypothetical protein